MRRWQLVLTPAGIGRVFGWSPAGDVIVDMEGGGFAVFPEGVLVAVAVDRVQHVMDLEPPGRKEAP